MRASEYENELKQRDETIQQQAERIGQLETEMKELKKLLAGKAEAKSAKKGHYLKGVWGDKDCDWKPTVGMKMKSDIANTYFQGKENVPIAMAMGRIKSSGSVPKALKLIPITKPIYRIYREYLEDEGYNHLLL